MAGVCDEAFHLIEGSIARRHGAVDAVEHRVERAVEPADFSVLVCCHQSLARVTGGDHGCRALYFAQRAQG